jgi:DnaJ-class molecular chaperone
MRDYQTRKAERTRQYHENHGRKMTICIACNGSGHYDHDGAPPCASCDGTGKVRERKQVEITYEQKLAGAIDYARGRMLVKGYRKARAAKLAADHYSVNWIDVQSKL